MLEYLRIQIEIRSTRITDKSRLFLIERAWAISMIDWSRTHENVNWSHFFRSSPLFTGDSLRNSRIGEEPIAREEFDRLIIYWFGGWQETEGGWSLCRIATRTTERLVPALDHRSRMGRRDALSRRPHLYLTLASLDIRLSSGARPLHLLALQRRRPRSHPVPFSSFAGSFLFTRLRLARQGTCAWGMVRLPHYYHRWASDGRSSIILVSHYENAFNDARLTEWRSDIFLAEMILRGRRSRVLLR